MPKRDRWSSDDENDDEGGKSKSNGDCKNDIDGGSLPLQPALLPSSLTTTTSSSSSSHCHHLHNPLLHGSRSVYDSYTRLSHIDSGTYGIVWRAKCNITNEIVALKQIKFDNELTKEGFPISALREINVLLALRHPNIVQVKEVVVGGCGGDGMMRQKVDDDDNAEMKQPQIYMVMECLEMDLQRAMMTPDPATSFTSTTPLRGGAGVLPFAQSEIKFIMHHLLSAVQHIHLHWYLHRDIKTSNILLRRNGHLALCDFGLARKYETPARAMTMSVVTLWYRAPELLFGECRYGPEIDMWSVGCIFGELLIKDAILKGNGELDQIQQIFKLLGPPTQTSWPTFLSLPSSGTFKWRTGGEGSRSSSSTPSSELRTRFSVNSSFSSMGCQSYLDSAGFDLLGKLLTMDPTRRMSAADALSHEYFTGGGVKMQVPDFFFT